MKKEKKDLHKLKKMLNFVTRSRRFSQETERKKSRMVDDSSLKTGSKFKKFRRIYIRFQEVIQLAN